MDSSDIEALRELDPVRRMEALKQQLIERVLLKHPALLNVVAADIVDTIYNAAALQEMRMMLMNLIDQVDDLIPQQELSGPVGSATRQIIEENPIRALRTGISEVQKAVIGLLQEFLQATGLDYQVEPKVVTDGTEYQRPFAKA